MKRFHERWWILFGVVLGLFWAVRANQAIVQHEPLVFEPKGPTI